MRSGVERGAERNVDESDAQSCGEVFYGPVSVEIIFSNVILTGGSLSFMALVFSSIPN